MNRRFFLVAALALLTVIPVSADERTSGLPLHSTPSPKTTLCFAGKTFSFSASCTVQCSNGQCRQHCEAGVVFAIDERDAKLKAEIKLRQGASREGTVVEGSVRVEVFNF